MSARRPLIVRQSEAGPNASNTGDDYWYTVAGGNGETMLTSKMYRARWRAIRAARRFIDHIDGPVTFTYWQGTTPTEDAEAAALDRPARGTVRYIVERIRQP